MELTSVIITVLIPTLAFMLHYSHHLQHQLAECNSERCNKTSPPEKGGTLSLAGRRRHLLEHGSSVLCQGNNNTDRRCILHNLCYHPGHESFVFLHSPFSIYEGVPEDRQQPSLVDLSSIPNHNTQYFDYVDVPSSFVTTLGNLTFREGQHLLFNRFNPGNLMHIFHDDLLPVFHSLRQLGFIQSNDALSRATLLINDPHDIGEYNNLYEHLSKNKPVMVNQLSVETSDLVCFEEVHVGLSTFTTWYQYGFQVPQGPLDNIRVTSKEISLYTSFLKSHLQIEDCKSTEQLDDKITIVVLSRRTNRLILNEVELTLALAQLLDAYVVVASLETHPLTEIIHLISCSKGLVGMHGSLLALSIFLPPDSILVELFPYAVNPNKYTPYRTLSSLEGMKIVYRSWRNENVQNTVAHPNAEPELGGISHLESKVQEEILSSTEVPQHLCCSHSEWLFRIYQDTVVDIATFVQVVESALKDLPLKGSESKTEAAMTFQPGPVRDAACFSVHTGPEEGKSSEGIGLLMSWQPPWNLPYILSENRQVHVEYEVFIQEQDEGESYSGIFVLPMTRHLFEDGFKNGHVYFAWIRCRAGGKTGPYVAVTLCPYEFESGTG